MYIVEIGQQGSIIRLIPKPGLLSRISNGRIWEKLTMANSFHVDDAVASTKRPQKSPEKSTQASSKIFVHLKKEKL